MALFTDGTISIIEDLVGYESGILETAVTERIDLTIKLSLAQDELGIDLDAYLTRQGSTLGLGNVVVTPPLSKCHTFRALVLAYRDAYSKELNDRYLAKLTEYQELADWAWDALVETGPGTVTDPIPRAASPQLSSIAAAAPAAATYFVRVSWVASDGEEGSPSDIATLIVAEGNTLVVTAANPPAQASGWNVYAGLSAEEQTLQNDGALPLGGQWTAPVTGLQQGTPAGTGQAPESYLLPGPNVMWR